MSALTPPPHARAAQRAATQALTSLNERRRRAVELRLAGQTLQQIRQETGLSAPTVIAAYKAFLSQGWKGIAIEALGRRAGEKRSLTSEEETELQRIMIGAPPEAAGLAGGLWTGESVQTLAQQQFGHGPKGRALASLLERAGLGLQTMVELAARHAALARWRAERLPTLTRQAQQQGATLVWCGQIPSPAPTNTALPRRLLVAQTLRGSVAWLALDDAHGIDAYTDFLTRLALTWPEARQVLLHGIDIQTPALADWLAAHRGLALHPCPAGPTRRPSPLPGSAGAAAPGTDPDAARTPVPTPYATPHATSHGTSHTTPQTTPPMTSTRLTHLQRLEAESIHILREVVAEAERPVMLYSIGKDSACMLHLAKKAFWPAPPPFPLLHVDTTWKFRDMYAMRERMAREMGMELLVWQNPEAKRLGINPFDHGSQIHTDLWKTQGLKQALEHHGFDAAFGGARRDEEKSRAKERIFSFRSAQHRWEPKHQRPELWHLYNARKHPGESIRVFPLSNWTELDVWQYIHQENIPVVPLYFARERPVVERNGTLIMVDDERMPLNPGEVPVMRKVRFRTLGCYPLSGAIESEAEDLADVIQEMLLARTSERQGRLIDHDQAASMEKKKQEGYF
jgi:sulfate adenylyltransferase subunit 2